MAHGFVCHFFLIAHPNETKRSITAMDWLGYFFFGNSSDGASSSIDPSHHQGGKEHRTTTLFPGDNDDEPTAAAADQPPPECWAGAGEKPSSFADVDDDHSSANAQLEDYPETMMENDYEEEEEDASHDDTNEPTPDRRRGAAARAGPPYRHPLLTGRRFRSELYCCQPWFQTTEPVNQRKLDMARSFAPCSIGAFVWKCAFCGIGVGTMTYEFLRTPHPAFQWAYLTQWATLMYTLYSVMSVLNTICSAAAAARTTTVAANAMTPGGFRLRLTWVLFELTVHLGATVTLLYWYEMFKPAIHFEHVEFTASTIRLEYRSVAAHGGLYALVLVDGFWVNRIPLRWMHYFGIILPMEALYALWTYLHFQFQIGNPNVKSNTGDTAGSSNDTNTDNDDAIYPGVLQWDDGWQEPLVYILVMVLAVGPVLFGLCWCISNGNLAGRDRRRYLDEPAFNGDDVDDEEGRPGTVDDDGPEGANQKKSGPRRHSRPFCFCVFLFACVGSIFSLWK
jgi:hypothetical protein